MSNLELMIGLAAAGALWQNIPVWQTLLQKLKLQVKPFACTLCWTFWMSLGYTLAESNINLLECLMISSGASILAEMLDRQLNNL